MKSLEQIDSSFVPFITKLVFYNHVTFSQVNCTNFYATRDVSQELLNASLETRIWN